MKLTRLKKSIVRGKFEGYSKLKIKFKPGAGVREQGGETDGVDGEAVQGVE